MTSAYIILGAPGSGRLEVLADLIASGTDGGDSTRVYLTDEFDAASVEKFTAAAAPAGAPPPQIRRWGVADGNLFMDSPEDAPETVFIVTAGRADPVGQMEILVALLTRFQWEVARIFTVVHCALLAANDALGDWYKACLHFSDAALLSRREGVPNAWMKKFTDAHKESCNPCLLELVKHGRVDSAARVLVPEARRLSLIFDDTDGLDEMEFDEDNLPAEPFDLLPKTDPYFERDDHGRRRINIPDITRFLG